MPLTGGYKSLQAKEDLYLMWPYQKDAINEVQGAIEELSRFSVGTGDGQLENTLGLIGKRLSNIMENLDERIPRSDVEALEAKGGDA